MNEPVHPIILEQQNSRSTDSSHQSSETGGGPASSTGKGSGTSGLNAVENCDATGATRLALELDGDSRLEVELLGEAAMVESVVGVAGTAALLELALATGTTTTVDTPDAVTVVPAFVDPRMMMVGTGEDWTVSVMCSVEVEKIVVVAAAAAFELSAVAVTVFWLVVITVKVCVVAGDEGAARDEAGVTAACVD